MCWNCGYDLTGLRVEERCPECGTPVWSGRPVQRVLADANAARTWGTIAIILFFVVLGPFAGVVAIPAVIKGTRVRTRIRRGGVDRAAGEGALTGLVLGWITIGLSSLWVAVFGLIGVMVFL
ncbi:MAG: hypothetical protein AAFR38_06545 [Planctomycetota bacterium]